MSQIKKNSDVSQEDLSPAVIERLVAYDDVKARAGRSIERAPIESPPDDLLVSDVACVDLLHRVWPDFESPAPSPDDFPNQILGDFRIIRELGSGGMGTVFEADQLSMGRRIALKVLPYATLANSKSPQRFRNEVRAAAALDHPHIVSVYSVGEERGVHFYAMQFIRGQSMADLIVQLQSAENHLWVTGGSGPLPHERFRVHFRSNRTVYMRSYSRCTDRRICIFTERFYDGSRRGQVPADCQFD